MYYIRSGSRSLLLYPIRGTHSTIERESRFASRDLYEHHLLLVAVKVGTWRSRYDNIIPEDAVDDFLQYYYAPIYGSLDLASPLLSSSSKSDDGK